MTDSWVFAISHHVINVTVVNCDVIESSIIWMYSPTCRWRMNKLLLAAMRSFHPELCLVVLIATSTARCLRVTWVHRHLYSRLCIFAHKLLSSHTIIEVSSRRNVIIAWFEVDRKNSVHFKRWTHSSFNHVRPSIWQVCDPSKHNVFTTKDRRKIRADKDMFLVYWFDGFGTEINYSKLVSGELSVSGSSLCLTLRW